MAMNIKQRFVVQHPPEVVWNALADVQLVAQCVPGAELDESSDGRNYKGRMRVKLGPIAAAFAGEAVVERDAASRTGVVEGKGADGRSNSRAKARMTYAVTPEAGGKAAAVAVEAEIILTGALAQFGRSAIVNDIAARLTADFADALQKRLAAAAPAGEAAAGEVAGTASPTIEAPPAKPAEIKPLQLLLGILWRRILALFGRGRSSEAS